VDIIHTAGATIGMFKTIGHADFYPNGGRKQGPWVFNFGRLR
jgi:hypothetical protein